MFIELFMRQWESDIAEGDELITSGFDEVVESDDDAPTDDVAYQRVVGEADAVDSAAVPSSEVPAPVPWPQAWHDFVLDIRSAGQPLFLEVFAGCAVMTAEMKAAGWPTAPPVDIATTPDFNVLNPMPVAQLYMFRSVSCSDCC